MLFLGFFISLFLGTVYGQIRYHEPHPEHKFNYSYINVRHVKGHKLTGEAPLSAFSTRNRTDCHRDCVKSKKSCKSINVAKTTEGFECQTMGIDIYSKGVLVADSASSHYIIAVSINYFRCYIDIFMRFFLCFPSFLLSFNPLCFSSFLLSFFLLLPLFPSSFHPSFLYFFIFPSFFYFISFPSSLFLLLPLFPSSFYLSFLYFSIFPSFFYFTSFSSFLYFTSFSSFLYFTSFPSSTYFLYSFFAFLAYLSYLYLIIHHFFCFPNINYI